MAPKATKKDGKKKKGEEQEESDDNQQATSSLKKAKKEPVEDQGPSEGKAIAEKKELDKMYQAMKYLDKKKEKTPPCPLQPVDHQEGENRLLCQVSQGQEV